MKFLSQIGFIAILAPTFAVSVLAQVSPMPGSVWFEDVLGNPEQIGAQTGRGLRQITNDSRYYKFENGEYTSVLSRTRLKLPQIATEEKVTVREAIPFRRPDGSIATTHIVILPGGMAPGPTDEKQAMSAVVVTRLRDDRPKDRESVLRQWEPQTEAQREQMGRNGIETRRVDLPRWGESVQRVVLNRASIEPFPYRMTLLRSADTATVSVSHFVVAGQDSVIEFSQILPCAGRFAETCKTDALAIADRFIGGVVEFLTISPQK